MDTYSVIRRYPPVRSLEDGTAVQDVEFLCMGPLPKHKRPSLYLRVINDLVSEIIPLATFSSEEAAEALRKWLEKERTL